MNRFTTLITSIALLAVAVPVMASTTGGSFSTTGLDTGMQGIVVAAPTASLDSGTYTGTQTVTLSAQGSSSIHYFLNTLDLDSALTCDSGATTSPVTVDGSGLLRAIACYGSKASPIASFNYVISTATTPATPSGGGGSVSPSTTTLIGDINGDGVVDILDFNALIVHWGQTGSSIAADLNHDGVVDVLDFTLLMAHWTI